MSVAIDSNSASGSTSVPKASLKGQGLTLDQVAEHSPWVIGGREEGRIVTPFESVVLHDGAARFHRVISCHRGAVRPFIAMTLTIAGVEIRKLRLESDGRGAGGETFSVVAA